MPEPRVLTSFSSIDPRQWQALERSDNPFLDYAFLAGLEETGSIGPHAGWRPHHLALYDGDDPEPYVVDEPDYVADCDTLEPVPDPPVTKPAGEVVAVNRGARRALQSVVIRLEGDEAETFGSWPASESSSGTRTERSGRRPA